MRKTALLAPIGALAMLLVLALAGCGSSSSAGSGSSGTATTSQATANAAFCASLDHLEAAAANLKSLDPKDTTINQLTAAAAELGAAWKDFTAAAKGASGVSTTAISDAWDGVTAAAKDLPGSGKTPSEAVQSMKDALVPLKQAADDLKPQCAGVSSTTGTTTGS